jgi:sulfite oxidase
MAGPQPDAKSVVFSDPSGYSRTLRLEAALADNVFLAHTLYGEQLPAVHGYPVRLVAGDYLGDYWVKWLAHIEVQ